MFEIKSDDVFGLRACKQAGTYTNIILNEKICENAAAWRWLYYAISELAHGDLTLLNAPCGSGKTFAVINAAKERYKRNNRTAILVVPTKTQALQIAREYAIPSFTGRDSCFPADNAIIVTVSDKAGKAFEVVKKAQRLNVTDLIIDEAHDVLVLDESYRKYSVSCNRQMLYEVQARGCGVMMISATPDILGAFKFTRILDFTSEKQTIKSYRISQYVRNTNCVNADYIVSSILNVFNEGAESVIVTGMDAHSTEQSILRLEMCGISCLSLSRQEMDLVIKDNQTSGLVHYENPMAESLVWTSKLPATNKNGTPVKCYFTTSVINTGVNITGYSDGVDRKTVPIFFLNKKSHMNLDAIIQFSNRLRFPCEYALICMPTIENDVYPKEPVPYAVFEREYNKTINCAKKDFNPAQALVNRFGVTFAQTLIAEDNVTDRTAAYCRMGMLQDAFINGYKEAYDVDNKNMFFKRKTMCNTIAFKTGVTCSIDQKILVLKGSLIPKEAKTTEFEDLAFDVLTIANTIKSFAETEPIIIALRGNKTLPKNLVDVVLTRPRALARVKEELAFGSTIDDIISMYSCYSKNKALQRLFEIQRNFVTTKYMVIESLLGDYKKEYRDVDCVTDTCDGIRLLENSIFMKLARSYQERGLSVPEIRTALAELKSMHQAKAELTSNVTKIRQGIIRTDKTKIAGVLMRSQEYITNQISGMRAERKAKTGNGDFIIDDNFITGLYNQLQLKFKSQYSAGIPNSHRIKNMLTAIYNMEPIEDDVPTNNLNNINNTNSSNNTDDSNKTKPIVIKHYIIHQEHFFKFIAVDELGA